MLDSSCIETRYAKSGELNIACQVFGQGDVDLVLIPGWASNVENLWSLREFAAFDGPARSTRCGAALVDAVRPLGLQLRAGSRACRTSGDCTGSPAEGIVSAPVHHTPQVADFNASQVGFERLRITGSWVQINPALAVFDSAMAQA